MTEDEFLSAIAFWLTSVTGLKFLRTDEDTVRPLGAKGEEMTFGTIGILDKGSSSRSALRIERASATPGDYLNNSRDAVDVVTRRMQPTLSINLYGADKSDLENYVYPGDYADMLIASLSSPAILTEFILSKNIGYVKSSNVREGSVLVTNNTEARAQFDITFNYLRCFSFGLDTILGGELQLQIDKGDGCEPLATIDINNNGVNQP